MAPRLPHGDHTSRAGAGAQKTYERRRDRRLLVNPASSAPQHEVAWARGAEGERMLAARLGKLLRDDDVFMLHDRRVTGTRANIDHIAVAPGGITIIDAKLLRGRINGRSRNSELWVAGRNRTQLIAGVQRQVAVVRESLTASPFDGVDVRGVLCLADPSGLSLLSGDVVIQQILVTGPRGAARMIRRRPDRSLRDLWGLCRLMEQRFPPYTDESPKSSRG